ncbi:outer membrane porin, OprD family (plasmid) [Pseudomonas luteola]|uniref:OprD family outer membrane porin n=1 Tax=Pseudomonas luteola TaxID=47886 RepID=UPI00388D1D73
MSTLYRAGFTLSLLALSLAAQAQSPAPDDPSYINEVQSLPNVQKPVKGQAGAKGFFEDDTLTLTTRNFAAREIGQDRFGFTYPKNGSRHFTHTRNTWVQGTALKYSSGYTQGTVGFGIDVAGFNAINLERGKGRIGGGGNRTLADSDGHGHDEWSKLGVADVRLRVSNTELKVGRFLIDTPVVSYNDNRALPSSFTGFGIVSDEWDNLSLQAGSFRRASPRTGAGDEKFTTEYGTREVIGDHLSYLGGNYKPLDGFEISLYGAQFEDVWNQYYLGLSKTGGDIKTFGWKAAFNGYRTLDQGDTKAGNINNTAWSMALTGSHQAHSLTFVYQQIEGNEYFDYAHETAAIYLGNSMFSDYNGPNEKSAQVRYETDWSYFGVPGLTTGIWYVKGWDIDGTHYNPGSGNYANYAEVLQQDGETHHELGLVGTYQVQSGRIKDSKFRLMLTRHKASQNQVDGSFKEIRLVSTLPFNFL